MTPLSSELTGRSHWTIPIKPSPTPSSSLAGRWVVALRGMGRSQRRLLGQCHNPGYQRRALRLPSPSSLDGTRRERAFGKIHRKCTPSAGLSHGYLAKHPRKIPQLPNRFFIFADPPLTRPHYARTPSPTPTRAGFANKWTIEAQINGDPNLCFKDPNNPDSSRRSESSLPLLGNFWMMFWSIVKTLLRRCALSLNSPEGEVFHPNYLDLGGGKPCVVGLWHWPNSHRPGSPPSTPLTIVVVPVSCTS